MHANHCWPETIVDTKVRKVWELDPDQFSLTNPKWPLMLDLLLREVETNLGLPLKKLAAHLYKLLVFEKGGFFLPHRAGEKLDRMVATLVINLPSKHSGGELVVYHEGRQTTAKIRTLASFLKACRVHEQDLKHLGFIKAAAIDLTRNQQSPSQSCQARGVFPRS